MTRRSWNFESVLCVGTILCTVHTEHIWTQKSDTHIHTLLLLPNMIDSSDWVYGWKWIRQYSCQQLYRVQKHYENLYKQPVYTSNSNNILCHRVKHCRHFPEYALTRMDGFKRHENIFIPHESMSFNITTFKQKLALKCEYQKAIVCSVPKLTWSCKF